MDENAQPVQPAQPAQPVKVTRPFKSKILFLDKKLISEINMLIEAGYRSLYLIKWMKAKHPDVTCGFDTYQRYIKWYLKQKKLAEDRVRESQPSVVTPSTPVGGESSLSAAVESAGNPGNSFVRLKGNENKAEILQGMLTRCIERLEALAKPAVPINPLIPQVGIDDKIQKYVKEIRSLIESMVKMDGKLEKAEGITEEELDKELQAINTCVKNAIVRVCPEKLEEFNKVLQEELNK